MPTSVSVCIYAYTYLCIDLGIGLYYSVCTYPGDRLFPFALLNLHFPPYLQLTFSEMFYIHICMCIHARAHTHTQFYFFTWWGPSYKYGIRPDYCDIIWRLDFFWCQYRCLYNVIITRIAATSSCGFQFINVSILKRKDCDKAMHKKLEQRLLGFLSIA